MTAVITAAVDLLRQRIKAASPGPWTTQDDDLGPARGGDVYLLDAADEPIFRSPDDGIRGGGRRPDADLVVTAVNVLPAVAAWLESTLSHWTRSGLDCRECGQDWPCSRVQDAERVAHTGQHTTDPEAVL